MKQTIMRYISDVNHVLQSNKADISKEILVFATLLLLLWRSNPTFFVYEIDFTFLGNKFTVRTGRDLKQLKEILKDISGIVNWNVDLEDWEKVLRIEGVGVSSSLIISLISKNGFFIKELE